MGQDITPAEGEAITAEAQSWKGTPYKLVGSGSIKGDGGDCSGSTWRIYGKAGFAYDYKATSEFLDYVATKPKFRELKAGEAAQEGDLLFWSDHMAIFTTFASDAADDG